MLQALYLCNILRALDVEKGRLGEVWRIFGVRGWNVGCCLTLVPFDHAKCTA